MLLTTHDTGASRHDEECAWTVEAESYDPPKYDENDEEVSAKPKEHRHKHLFNNRGVYCLIVFNEAHVKHRRPPRVKRPPTRRSSKKSREPPTRRRDNEQVVLVKCAALT